MKTRLIHLFALFTLLPALFGCSDKEETKSDAVTLTGDVKEIVFTSEDTSDKSVSFTASTSWTVTFDPSTTDWVEVTPASGGAGDATVTVRLKQPLSRTENRATAIISAGTARASFQIVQQASILAEQINVTAPAMRLPAGKTMQLMLETEPEDVVRGQITWSSSDESVLTVDSDGVVTAGIAGTAVVTAEMDGVTDDLALEVTEVYTTDGRGHSYTFIELSELGFSGVTAENGVYTLTADMTLADEDTLVLGDGEHVKIAAGVELRILGTVEFTPANSASLSAVNADDAEPIYFTGEVNGGGKFTNVEISGLPIRCFGTKGLTFENCKFTGVASDSYGAINLGGSELVTVSGCEFIENNGPAISGGANLTSPLLFKNNKLYKNSKTARNRPQINVTVAGNGDVVITGNTVVGPGEVTTNGGIAVSNMAGIAGTNRVLIEANKVSDCRYGITTNGVMVVWIIDNVLENNKWDSNPMNGGSGVSIYNSKGGQRIYMCGNTIRGHLWGITNIGNVAGGKGPSLNLGNLTQGDDYNPGGNVFSNNGNGGKLYDLYNNSPMTVYAQGNTWNVATQDEASIEEVIYHKNDQATLGEVIFMPAAQQ